MNKFLYPVFMVFGLVIVSPIISGCSSTQSVKQNLDSSILSAGKKAVYKIENIDADTTQDSTNAFKPVLMSKINEALSKTNSVSSSNSAYKVKITISEYKMRSDAARLMLGVLAGSDSVKSTVSVTDPKTGNKLGETVVETSNAMAVGSAESLAVTHANEVVTFLTGGTTDHK